MTIHWKAVEQYFTSLVLFVFSVRSERVQNNNCSIAAKIMGFSTCSLTLLRNLISAVLLIAWRILVLLQYRSVTIHWKPVDQYFTVLFVFQFNRICHFGKFIYFGLGTVSDERVKAFLCTVFDVVVMNGRSIIPSQLSKRSSRKNSVLNIVSWKQKLWTEL